MTEISTRRNPYPGPVSFQIGETLYGRARETRQLVNLLIAERIVLLYSPSGAGKTSLIQAALIPELEREGFRVFRPARVSLAAEEQVSGVINRYIFSLLLSWEANLPDGIKPLPHRDLATMTLAAYLALRTPERAAATDEGEDMSVVEETWDAGWHGDMLIFDQFEEILTVDLTDREAKHDFFDQVGEVLQDRQHWALFAMREEFLARLDPYLRPIPTRFATTFRLELLGKEGALDAVIQPALFGEPPRTYAPGVAEMLVDNLRRIERHPRSHFLAQAKKSVTNDNIEDSNEPGDYVEPVHLQIVCRDLWARLPAEQTEIQESDLQSFGDVDQALTNFYESALVKVIAETAVSERTLRRWFSEQLITPTRAKALVYRNEVHGETAGLNNDAINILQDAWMIRADIRSGDIWYELAHDRLVEPILKANLVWEANYHNPVASAYARWESGEADELLLSGLQLAEAEQYIANNPEELTPEEETYLEESRRYQSRLQTKRRQLVIVAVVSFIIIFLVASTIWQSYSSKKAIEDAGIQNAIAESRQLANQSDQALKRSQRIQALMLGIRAGAIYDTTDAFAAIRNAINPSSWVISQTLQLEHVVEEITWDGGQRIAAVGGDQRIVLLDPVQGQTIDAWTIPPAIDLARRVGWNQAGTRLATGHKSGELIIWEDGTPLQIIKAHDGAVNSVAWYPSNEINVVATGGDDGELHLWNLGNSQASISIEVDAGINRINWDSTGARLAIAGRDGVIRAWDVAPDFQLSQVFLLRAYDLLGATDIDWSDDKQTLLSAGTLGLPNFKPVAHLWTLSGQPLPLMAYGGHNLFLYQAKYSPQGTLIATAGEDLEIRIWSAQNGTLSIILRGHEGPVYSLIWLDESNLLSAGADGRILLWSLVSAGELPLKTYGARVSVLRWLDDEMILSAAHDGHGQVWRAADGNDLMTIEHGGAIYRAQTNEDKTQLLTTSEDGTVGVWDLEKYEPITRLGDRSGRYIYARWNWWDESLILAGYECVNRPACPDDRYEIHLWQAAHMQPDVSPPPDLILTGHSNSIQTARWNPTDLIAPQGTRMVTASNDGTIRVWDVALDSPTAGQVLETHVHATDDISTTLSTMDRWVMEAKWNSAGSALLSYSRDGTARIWPWDSAENRFSSRPPFRHNDPVSWADWLEDDTQVITTSDDGIVRIWDVESGTMEHELVGHAAAIVSAEWVDATKSRLVTASEDATAILWETTTATLVRRFVGHIATISGVRVDAETALLLTYSRDKTAKLWNLDTGETLSVFTGHADDVVGADWNQTHTRLITGGKSGEVRQYYREMSDLLRAACDIATATASVPLSMTLRSDPQQIQNPNGGLETNPCEELGQN